nr:exodeoxyribonuclease V subunit gamma [Actinobacillus succinogenes]
MSDFFIYHSNDLDVQAGILISLLQQRSTDPFQSETILVQSPGMAQWLQLKIAEADGIAANLRFPMPASFIWQQYADNLPDVSEQSPFGKEAMTWHLMALLAILPLPRLNEYWRDHALGNQEKRYQLARQIADLFDQYLVYRPDWIDAWEKGDDRYIENQLRYALADNPVLLAQIKQDIRWQGQLWRELVAAVCRHTKDSPARHRVNLHLTYLNTLATGRPKNLPPRIFVFGISALPKAYLETLQAISRHSQVHLFFNNPSKHYWGDLADPRFIRELSLKTYREHGSDREANWLSETEKVRLKNGEFERSADDELLQIGHPLLATWGKLGRDFFYLLSDLNAREFTAYTPLEGADLLTQVKNRILNLVPDKQQPLQPPKADRSVVLHACHSPMREVEVLHDYLLRQFQADETLTPKDIVVMVADIDRYTPYIQAVFGQYQRYTEDRIGKKRPDERYIPFSISDGKLSENDVLLATYLSLLDLKNSQFSAEEVLAFLDVPAIREKFEIALSDLPQIRHWVARVEIRFGLDKNCDSAVKNYNAWQAGLERLLLGYAMRESQGIWQDSLGFDDSDGLKGQVVGNLAAFLDRLAQWHTFLQQSHSIEKWQQNLTALLTDFFVADEQTVDIQQYIRDAVRSVTELLRSMDFQEDISAEVMAEVMTEKLNDNPNSLKFLVGKVSFCTLLPMRSIPFRVVCLLGMNENDYPRRRTPNSFDLMRYHRRKGDRSRRDDDRYLFLEALLAAQEQLYISYVGRSITDNQPRQPSVVVSQLQDYINDNLADNALRLTEKVHPMTIFSPQNFYGNDRTFAKEWLPSSPAMPSGENKQAVLPLTEKLTRIELDQLVKFVRHPVKYFFENQLGVYFQNDDDLIPDTENFTLDGLDLYRIKDDFLTYSDEELCRYFERLSVKGILPRGNFGKVYEAKVRSEMETFREKVRDYLLQTPQTQAIELDIDGVKITGNLTALYGDSPDKRRIAWRVGNLSDGFGLENWVYHLAKCATGEVTSSLMITRDKSVTLAAIAAERATAQLGVYVRAYLCAMNRIQCIPTMKITALLKCRSADELRRLLDNAARPTDYNRGDPYWRRLLLNLDDGELTDVLPTLTDWFAMLVDAYEKA